MTEPTEDDVLNEVRARVEEDKQHERKARKNGGDGGPQPDPQPSEIRLLTQKQFLAGFIPPDYLVDGVLQRRFIYALTAVTGHGKTALALLLARTIGSVDPDARFGPHAAEKGKAVYFVGENPDDVRCRIIGANSQRADDPDQDRIYYIAGVFDIAGLQTKLNEVIAELGGVDLVIVDTSAAYFLKDDENSNPQMGTHARMLRSLTTLPGGPCVVTLCHPIKHVTDPSQLLPRGGGAFLNEMDGNLTLWKHDDNLVTLHHSDKFRGPGFEPMTFKLEKITTTKLVDSKGRLIPTVHAVAITEQEEAQQEASAEQEENQLLAALAGIKALSIADLARACSWLLPDGGPYKNKVQRVLDRLLRDKLVKKVRGRRWRLTDEGRKAAGVDNEDEDEQRSEDRGGAGPRKRKSKVVQCTCGAINNLTAANCTNCGAPLGDSGKPFSAIVGEKARSGVPCAHCGHVGDVYKIADGRLKKGQRHREALHEGCAEAFFTGQPKPY
jgi:hypothetical protein